MDFISLENDEALNHFLVNDFSRLLIKFLFVCVVQFLTGMVRSQEGLSLEAWRCELAREGEERTMPASGGFHNTEVLNCQQECENDAIKAS